MTKITAIKEGTLTPLQIFYVQVYTAVKSDGHIVNISIFIRLSVFTRFVTRQYWYLLIVLKLKWINRMLCYF